MKIYKTVRLIFPYFYILYGIMAAYMFFTGINILLIDFCYVLKIY